MMRNGFLLKAILLATVLTGISLSAQASTFYSVGTDSDGRWAEADFTIAGNQLQIELRNRSLQPALDGTWVLTAVFFDLVPANPTLTPVSAVLAGGSGVNTNNKLVFPENATVGGEWAYARGNPLHYRDGQGVSSSGLGLFGDADFPGGNLAGPANVDGLQYGIISNAKIARDNGQVVDALKGIPLAQNAVDFTLSDGDLTGMTVKNVVFQYGKDFPGAHFVGGTTGGATPSVPEPLTMIGAFLGISSLGAYIRKRTKATAV